MMEERKKESTSEKVKKRERKSESTGEKKKREMH